jgi:hypothetical protein
MELIQQYELLAGFAALVAALVNALKVFGVVKEGAASWWSLAISSVGLIVFISLKLFQPEIDVPGLDAVLRQQKYYYMRLAWRLHWDYPDYFTSCSKQVMCQ